MSESMFIDDPQHHREITIDGFSEKVVIRPLSNKEQGEACGYMAAPTIYHSGGQSGGQEITWKDRKATVNLGLVRIGDRTEDDWSKVLTEEALEAIADAIWDLTEQMNQHGTLDIGHSGGT